MTRFLRGGTATLASQVERPTRPRERERERERVDEPPRAIERSVMPLLKCNPAPLLRRHRRPPSSASFRDAAAAPGRVVGPVSDFPFLIRPRGVVSPFIH